MYDEKGSQIDGCPFFELTKYMSTNISPIRKPIAAAILTATRVGMKDIEYPITAPAIEYETIQLNMIIQDIFITYLLI